MTALDPSVRQQFHIPGPGPYLLAHAAGCLPRVTPERLEADLFAPWQAGGNDAWGQWLGAIDRFRAALGGVLGTSPALICPQPNVSAGFARWLGALPAPAPDRRDIVMSSNSFPSLGFVAGGMERLGYRLRLLPDDMDVRHPDQWRAAINQQTAVVLASHVYSTSGAIAPVTQIVAAARAVGARACIDVAQSVGIMPTPLDQWCAHAVVGSCLKWLCGGTGAGFIALDGEDLDSLDPHDRGWWSHADPFEMDIRSFRAAPDALRMWGGTPDIAPFIIATAGIETVSGIGIAAIRAHGQMLQLLARETLAPLRPDWHWPQGEVGGTLCIGVGNDAASLPAIMADHGIHVDFRRDVMRMSFAAWNGPECVEKVAAVLG